MDRIEQKYKTEVVPALMKEFNYSSIMEVPRLKKIVLSSGVGEAVHNSKALEHAKYAMERISGQKIVVTKARKSISNFKLREGYPIGCMVTLRRSRMNNFFDRLVSIALPRVRDFRGLSKRSFDGRGNYNLGIKEQIVFPEIEVEKLDKIRGMDITFVTTAKTNEEALMLLQLMGLPFRN
ncbi:MAG: 50S ribosomal protein L5 [Bdellovibrionota bacterium]